LGGDKVKLVRYESGDWQMLVEGNPFIIKGITYAPTRVGESPDKGTLENWTVQDTNHNGLIDAPFEAWVDKNTNDIQDKDEAVKGDFFLMKEMGVNCLRLYHQPAKINKELIRQMYAKYGIYIILGDFLGKYALGSNAPWDPGTDYDDPLHRENMLASVKEMVLEFKDEPYVLFWILGNENVYGVACNANKKPESFFKFANEAARLIKSLDPRKRPVAIASGDTLFLDIFAKNCPDIDIFGSNCYRGRYGFLDLWDEVERLTDKPAFITEYGAPSYAKGYTLSEGEEFQALYHWRCWQDIFCNSGGFGAGNAVGGIVFEWLDEWWKAYEPSYHDKKGLFTGPFLDGYMHEEWLGLVGQGNGKHSPFLRQLKKSYYAYQELWNEGCQKGLLKK
jgi:beta-glucuronidase